MDTLFTQVFVAQLKANIFSLKLSWLIKSFSQKWNLLRSVYFLPTTARADFYFKVI